MKMLLLILVVLLKAGSGLGQVLEFSVDNIESITAGEKRIIKDYLKEPNRTVYVSAPKSDSVFLKMINQYRQSKKIGLKILKHSQRLDTLCNIITHKNAELSRMTHYGLMPDLKNVYDLLNLENILYATSLAYLNSNSFLSNTESQDIVDLKKLLQCWIDSPGHNKNLLANLEVGTVKVLLKITRSDNFYRIDTNGVFEIDNMISKRELNQKVIKSNEESRQLVLEKIKKLRKRK